MILFLKVFVGILTVKVGCQGISDSFTFWDPLPPTELPYSATYEGLCIIFLYLFILRVWLISLGGLVFPEGKWKRSESGGEERCKGKMEETETAVQM